MKFFLDENFPKIAGRFLQQAGHEIFDIRSTEFEGSDDRKIFEFAQTEKAIFLTTDRDFFHTIPYLFDEHFGVVVIALKQPNRKRIKEKIEWFVNNFNQIDMKNEIFLLRDYHFTRS